MTSNDLSAKLYQEIARANEPRIMSHWHASSLSHCPRAQYMARKGVEPYKRPTAAKMLRWGAGHDFEARVRPYLKELYPNLQSNVRILETKKFDLTGEFDNYDPDSEQLIEIKTVGPRAIRYKKVSEDRFNLRDDKPYLAHELQQHAYVLLLQEVDDIEIKGITYLYITLEGLLVPYMTPVKNELLAEVSRRLAMLNVAWKTQTPPSCLCISSDPLWGSATQFCDYRKDDGCCDLTKDQIVDQYKVKESA